MTTQSWLQEAESRLRESGIESAYLEAQMLAGHVLRVDRSWLLAHPDHEFNELAGEQLLQRRLVGEPLAYILGWREFYGRTFGVDPSVLIPRHETETLIEAALALGPPLGFPNGGATRPTYRPTDLPTYSVLDMGTGSGILAVTLKLERPSWEVTAVDISPPALSTASANARFLGALVRFLLSDGFEAMLGESFDMIVSNPPYVGTAEKLPREVSHHEPEQALYAGSDGLDFYRRISEQAKDHLNDGGSLLLEVGHTQSEAVQRLFESGGWTHVETRRDLSGIERVLAFRHQFECP